MPQQRDTQKQTHASHKQEQNVGKLAAGSSIPEPGFEPGPAPPEETNYQHPTAPGERTSVPGAGVVRAGADAGPVHGGPDPDAGAPAPPYPGQSDPTAKQFAPGAIRPGTTDSGAKSTPVFGGGPGIGANSSRATEAPSAGGKEPLSADTAGEPGPVESEPVPNLVYNPNFSAANRAGDIPDKAGSDRRIDRGPHFRPDGRAGQRRPDLVGDVMTANVECCTPDSELYYVARMMADRDVGAIPVVASTEEMKPVEGIITDRDIVVRIVAKRQDPHAMRARDCMSTDVLTVTPKTGLEDCLRRMEERQVRRVVVVDDEGRCCGILAQADVARFMPKTEAGELVRDVSRPEGSA